MVESIRELRKICQTKKQPLYMELISMKISIYLTKIYLYTKSSADYVTILMILLLILGAVFIAFGNLWLILAGILIIHFTVILDNVNGEVARYWKEDGLIGTFLEQVYHNLATPLIFFALAFGVFLKGDNIIVLIFGFLCGIFGKPLVLQSVKDAVIAERQDELKKGIFPKLKILKIENANIKGGSSKAGKRLYYAYDIIREFWLYPANIVHITLFTIIELISFHYKFIAPYIFLSSYLILYGIVSVLIQTSAFIVNYKGRTVEHYYVELFGKK